MRGVKLETGPAPLRALFLGAHSDDIELGCGGTVLAMTGAVDVEAEWHVFAGGQQREREAKESAAEFLAAACRRTIVVHDFRDGFFPYVGGEIKERFERIKENSDPDIVFTHARCDLHQDHRLLNELTWNTFRDHLILEYEVPKYDGDFGSPNLFVPLDDDIARRKVELLCRHFKSQQGKSWFRKETFEAVMRLRGMESRAKAGWAEAFYSRKAVVSLGKGK